MRLTLAAPQDRQDLQGISRIAGGLDPSTAGSVVATSALLAEIRRAPLFAKLNPGIFDGTTGRSSIIDTRYGDIACRLIDCRY